MTKSQQKIKDEFIQKMKDVPIMIKSLDWSMTLEEYTEEESWLRNKN